MAQAMIDLNIVFNIKRKKLLEENKLFEENFSLNLKEKPSKRLCLKNLGNCDTFKYVLENFNVTDEIKIQAIEENKNNIA